MSEYLVIGLFSLQSLIIIFLVLCILKFNNRQYKQLSDVMVHLQRYNLTVAELNRPYQKEYEEGGDPRNFLPRATDADEADIEAMRDRA